jgi:hypothetical protein
MFLGFSALVVVRQAAGQQFHSAISSGSISFVAEEHQAAKSDH